MAVGVGGTGVAVGGMGVGVGGTGVAVGGTAVAVGGSGVAVGGTVVAVDGIGVDVGGGDEHPIAINAIKATINIALAVRKERTLG